MGPAQSKDPQLLFCSPIVKSRGSSLSQISTQRVPGGNAKNSCTGACRSAVPAVQLTTKPVISTEAFAQRRRSGETRSCFSAHQSCNRRRSSLSQISTQRVPGGNAKNSCTGARRSAVPAVRSTTKPVIPTEAFAQRRRSGETRSCSSSANPERRPRPLPSAVDHRTRRGA